MQCGQPPESSKVIDHIPHEAVVRELDRAVSASDHGTGEVLAARNAETALSRRAGRSRPAAAISRG